MTLTMNPLYRWISILLMVLLAPLAQAEEGADQDVMSLEQARVRFTALRNDLESLLINSGGGAVAERLRREAEDGVDLSRLRQWVYLQTGGTRGLERIPAKIHVNVHPKAMGDVVFANRMLRESGVDFIEYVGVKDESLPAPDASQGDDANAYRRWRRARLGTLPFLGFASAVSGGLLSETHAVSSEALGFAFASFGLEANFTIFNKSWLKLWTDDRPVISGRIRELQNAEASRLKEKLNGLIVQLNRAADSLSFVKRSHAWSYVINWGYTLVLYAGGMIGASIGGGTMPHFDIVEMVANSWVMNTAFFVSFGLSQIALANLGQRGEISELLRFQMETTFLEWNSVWRLVSLVPGLNALGTAMQWGFTAAVSAPLLLKLAGTGAYARETARLFAANAGEPIPERGRCQAALSAVYERTPMRTHESIWRAVGRWGRLVAEWVRGGIPAR